MCSRRRVTILHPSLGLGDLPRREIRPFEVADLLAPPTNSVPDGELADREAHVWSYQQTDPNQHVHAMEYVRVMEAFAADQLARRGRSGPGVLRPRPGALPAAVLHRRLVPPRGDAVPECRRESQ